MNGSTLHRAKQPNADPIGDFLSQGGNGNGNGINNNRIMSQPSQRRPSPRSGNPSVLLHPTFQKVLLLLILVVAFDAVHVYKFLNGADGEAAERQVEVAGVNNMKARRMDGLADHVIAKLKNDRAVGGGIANDGPRAGVVAAAAGGGVRKKKKLEPSWKADKRLNPDLVVQDGVDGFHDSRRKRKAEPSWMTERRTSVAGRDGFAGFAAENNHDFRDDKSEAAEADHYGISNDRFDSLEKDEKLEELQLEVTLWKGRYEMTVKKLHRLEDAFTHQRDVPDNREVNHLIYEGMDVEKVNQPPDKLAQHDDGNELYDPYKTDPFDHSEETYGVDEHILKILHAAGVEIDEELAAQLPTWEDVVGMYGPTPIIYGLETCEPYRNLVKPEDRMTGPAGLFNTGTNLLFELMKVNCDIKEARMRPRREPKHNGMRWQAPWGKHNPPATHRFKNVAKAWGKGIKQDDFMPIVLIKDPYSWMGSQCRHKYSSYWGHDENHCPNLIRWKVPDRPLPSEVVVKFALEMKQYESLLDMWTSWYMEWEEMTFPHLITRFEDLLFHGEEVVRTACDCVGGVFTDDFQYVEDSAKPNTLKVHKGSNGLVSAMMQYGDPAKRLTGFTERDMAYAEQTMNKYLMEKYGYRPPPPLVSTTEQEQ